MNILDMNDVDLRSVCYRASEQLMWDGRQQTEPAEMHRYALAAACAEMYPDALRHFRRDKVLAAFDLSLTDNERDGIYADMESNGGRLGIEASAKLSAFLNATAIRHVALDEYSALDSMRGGFPTTNFGAVMELCAGEVSGTDLVSPAQHASKLRLGAHPGKENDMNAKAIEEVKELIIDNPEAEIERHPDGLGLDTPDGVKEALLSGKDLYNTETGEFWWLYNATDSIATATIHLDDPNLLAVIDNPDFDLYEDIVGGLNYTGYITDSIETIIEDGEEEAPPIDPRDEVFAQIASEDGWVVATPENVRAAVYAHMPEKENPVEKIEHVERVAKGDSVRDWYMQAFPTDELGAEINPQLTFDKALAAVPTGNGFYSALGDASDSVVRERVFEELGNRFGYSYDDIYDSWVHERPLPEPPSHGTALTDGLDLDAEAGDVRGVADGLASLGHPEAPGLSSRGR